MFTAKNLPPPGNSTPSWNFEAVEPSRVSAVSTFPPAPKERLVFYYQQAESALQRATATPDPVLRHGLLNLAASWQRLIRETEALIEKTGEDKEFDDDAVA